jgi:hypothetical protein
MRAWKLSWGLALAIVLAACGGGGGGAVPFNPDEPTPTRVESADGRISAIVPVGAVSAQATLSLINRSKPDHDIAGPEGRTVLGAFDFLGTPVPQPEPGTNPGGGTTSAVVSAATPVPVTLSAAVAVSFQLSPALPAGRSLTIYTYNASSNRYEEAGFTGKVSDDGAKLEFSLSQFGRFAFYSLLPEEYPPAAPAGLAQIAASTQVRRLQWLPVADATTAGYNIYRAEAGKDAFAKVNTDIVAGTEFSDELAKPGAYRYRITTVNTGQLESEPSAIIESAAVDFDLYFSFGLDRLVTPLDIEISPAGDLLAVADPPAHCVWLYHLDGTYQGRVNRYGPVAAQRPVSVAFSTDGAELYIADRDLFSVFILDAASLGLTSRFGTEGSGPGEFTGLYNLAVTYDAELIGDKVAVADDELDTLQTFTALGVYLDTPLTAGTAQGLLADPGQMLYTAAGDLYITERGNLRVEAFDKDFVYKAAYTLPAGPVSTAPLPAGIALDFRGRTYISDALNRRVLVYSSATDVLFHFGADGDLRVEFSDTTGPRALALDPRTGYLYVADSGAHRIVVFTS